MNVVEYGDRDLPKGSRFDALKQKLEGITPANLGTLRSEHESVGNVTLYMARTGGNHGDIEKVVFAVHGNDAVLLGTITESGGHGRSSHHQSGSASRRHLETLAARFAEYQASHDASPVPNGGAHEAAEGSEAARLLAKFSAKGNGGGRGNGGRH